MVEVDGNRWEGLMRKYVYMYLYHISILYTYIVYVICFFFFFVNYVFSLFSNQRTFKISYPHKYEPI